MRIKILLILGVLLFQHPVHLQAQSLSNKKFDGYRPIWFELNQKYEYGDKYSGALGTYTAKHKPLAIYAPEVDKTFFIYGGTTTEKERHLLCMIGTFDHKSGMISKPVVVCDKEGVNDPHDNPSLLIGKEGYVFVFVSGRGRKRPGFKFRSAEAYRTDRFEKITEEEMTYPQPWKMEDGYFHFFTKYTGVRQLYFESSRDGVKWTDDLMLAAIPEKEGEKSGHYQVSGTWQKKIAGTFFNRHPDGVVDKRTDLYYVQTLDLGESWTNVQGEEIQPPITERASSARVVNYRDRAKNVYLKDMGFDKLGNPACLYVRSNGHEPGPSSAPYEWCLTKWNGKSWKTSLITTGDHNYDMGSLYISGEEWLIVAPTEPGPQEWGVGGELAVWRSSDSGDTWEKVKQLTNNSERSHSYVRRPVNFKPPFCFFWADGHSHNFSKSELYFGDFEGNIWKLPYSMETDYETPKKIR